MRKSIETIGGIGSVFFFLFCIIYNVYNLVNEPTEYFQRLIYITISLILILIIGFGFVKLLQSPKYFFFKENADLRYCAKLFYIVGWINIFLYLFTIITDLWIGKTDDSSLPMIIGYGLGFIYSFWVFFAFINRTKSSLILSRIYLLSLLALIIWRPIFPYPFILNKTDITFGVIFGQVVNILIITFVLKGVIIILNPSITNKYEKNKISFFEIFILSSLTFVIVCSFNHLTLLSNL